MPLAAVGVIVVWIVSHYGRTWSVTIHWERRDEPAGRRWWRKQDEPEGPTPPAPDAAP